MAASMRGCSKLKFSRLTLRICKRLSSQQHPHETKYFVALPELPKDTPETNSLLKYEELPKFDLPPGKVLTGVAKRVLEYDVVVEKVLENIEKNGTPASFEEIFDPIEKARVPMWYAHSVGSHMIHSKSDYKLGLVCERNDKQITRTEGDRWSARPLNEAIKTLQKNTEEISPRLQRMVDFYLYNGRIHGADIKKMKTYDELIHYKKRMEYFCNQFNNNLSFAFRLYMTKVEKRSELGPIPDYYLSLMVPPGANINKGPYNLNLTPQIYKAIMQYCSNRHIRKDIWENYNAQAGQDFVEQNASNGLTINDIRDCRDKIAETVGFKNFAEMTLSNRMVGSIENLSNFLNVMRTAVVDQAKNDVELIRQFAKSQGFRPNLEVWDFDYFKNERKRHLFRTTEGILMKLGRDEVLKPELIRDGSIWGEIGPKWDPPFTNFFFRCAAQNEKLRNSEYEENEVAQYFPFTKVRDNMFKLSTDLFGVQFEKMTGCDTVHPSVEVYKVIEEDGSEAGLIYLDPYRRPYKFEGFYSETCRDHSDVAGTKPIVFLTLNLPQPLSEKEPSLMSFQEMYTMLGEFGCTLQNVLAKSAYSELAGQNNMAEDAVNICYHVMKEFALEPTFIRQISSHHSTGEPIPQDLLETVLNASKHMMAYEVSKELYQSAFDLELHIKSGIWYPHMERMWKLYMPIPLHEDDFHPCHMKDMIAGDRACSYYCNLWTQMIATDVFKAFQETGFNDPEKLAAVGRRFRDTFLYHGGDEDPCKTFLEFRGRDPSPSPFQELFKSE